MASWCSTANLYTLLCRGKGASRLAASKRATKLQDDDEEAALHFRPRRVRRRVRNCARDDDFRDEPHEDGKTALRVQRRTAHATTNSATSYRKTAKLPSTSGYAARVVTCGTAHATTSSASARAMINSTKSCRTTMKLPSTSIHGAHVATWTLQRIDEARFQNRLCADREGTE